MALILDLIIVAIFVLSIIITAKKGFVKSVSVIVVFLVAIFASMSLSAPIADYVYEKAVEPGVVTSIEKAITEGINETEEGLSKSIWQALPAFIRNSNGAKQSDFEISVADVDTAHSVAVRVSEDAVKPIAVSFVKVITSLILFVVFSFAAKLITKLLDKIFSFSIVGKLNRFLGGILGLVNGAIYAIIFILLTSFLISLTGGFLFFTNTAVSEAKLYNAILSFLPGIF